MLAFAPLSQTTFLSLDFHEEKPSAEAGAVSGGRRALPALKLLDFNSMPTVSVTQQPSASLLWCPAAIISLTAVNVGPLQGCVFHP